MAERRMFAKKIIDSDVFLDMPLSTQALYFHLAMRADDEGFINNPKRIARMVGAPDDEMKLLIAKGFIIPFESGIVVIKHWRIHNYIQKDRFKPTIHTFEKANLAELPNKEYELVMGTSEGMYTKCIQGVSNLDTQVRLGKDSLGKSNTYLADPGEISDGQTIRDGANAPECVDQPEPKETAKAKREREAEELFESLWSQYPRKMGKAKVSKTKKLELLKVGADAMQTALDRYKRDNRETKPEYIQHGSTWFNGGYLDYLDGNYAGPKGTGWSERDERREKQRQEDEAFFRAFFNLDGKGASAPWN